VRVKVIIISDGNWNKKQKETWWFRATCPRIFDVMDGFVP